MKKSICQIVFEYIDKAEPGDIITRQGLIKYCEENYEKPFGMYAWKDGSSYNSIDNYRRVFQYNNILSDSDGSGRYIKRHNIPNGVTFNELKKRGDDNPLFTKNSGSVFDFID